MILPTPYIYNSSKDNKVLRKLKKRSPPRTLSFEITEITESDYTVSVYLYISLYLIQILHFCDARKEGTKEGNSRTVSFVSQITEYFPILL